MGLIVNPEHLKTVTKLTAQVKDISAGGSKRYQWAGLHRLVYDQNGLTLFSNDGQAWLEWRIPVEEGESDPFEAIIQAQKFNDPCSRSTDGAGTFEIAYGDGALSLNQGATEICIRLETPQPYPDPEKVTTSSFEKQEFSVNAATLSRNLKFSIPFIDANNATAARQVVTWTSEGQMICGSPRHFVRISGLPQPPISLSFKQKSAKSVTAFLNALEGDVYVAADGVRYIFTCPVQGHRLIVSGESVNFPPSLQKLHEDQTDDFKFDGKALANTVFLLSSQLPAELDRLMVVISGERENATFLISTLAESRNSKSRLPIVRETAYDGPPPERKFDINCRVFETVLAQMNGVILDGKYYYADRWFSVEDERSSDEDSYRKILVPVQDLSVPAGESEGNGEKEIPSGTKSPSKKAPAKT